MNCADFHRQLLVDPHCVDTEFLAHADACPDCAKRVRSALEFEHKLKCALEAETRTGARWLRTLSSVARRHRWGLAAGMAPVLGLAIWLSGVGYPPSETSASAVLEQVEEEIDFLDLDRVRQHGLGRCAW